MKPLYKLRSSIKNRPLFFLSIIVAVILYILLDLTTLLKWSTKLLICWDIAVLCYLFITAKILWKANQKHIFKRAEQQDEGKWIIFLLVMTTLLMCLVAIAFELTHLPKEHFAKFGRLLLSMFTIMCAWVFIHTMFAIHYAHDYYLALNKVQNGGLDFPKTDHPTYPDFIYFSYVIGTSAQTADVALTSSTMRKLNLLHIMIAYGFNTTILAIVINIAASLVST